MSAVRFIYSTFKVEVNYQLYIGKNKPSKLKWNGDGHGHIAKQHLHVEWLTTEVSGHTSMA